MTCNIGETDRLFRFLFALGFLLTAMIVSFDTPYRIGLLVLAGIALATAVTRVCPLYTVVGLNTNRA